MANKPLLCLFLLNQEETRGKDSISPECSARNTGLQGCMSRKQHVFKQLSCMTKGKLMTLVAHTFPVLEEMQISWLGSFPQDGGLHVPAAAEEMGAPRLRDAAAIGWWLFGIKDFMLKCVL